LALRALTFNCDEPKLLPTGGGFDYALFLPAEKKGFVTTSEGAVDDHLLQARILLTLGLCGRAPARAPPRTGYGLFDDVSRCPYEKGD
jgi:hypothetical protein